MQLSDTFALKPNAPFSEGGDCALTPRGFTDHEMMDDLGLVPMTKRASAQMAQPSALRRVSRCGCPLGATANNGRIYDPVMGRFLSADPFVPNPGNLQDYNRYSYVRNNPLRFVDPSGFTPQNVPDGYEEAKRQARTAASQLNRMLGHLGGGVQSPMLGQFTAIGTVLVEIITTVASDNAQTARANAVERVDSETPNPGSNGDDLNPETPPADSAGNENAGDSTAEAQERQKPQEAKPFILKYDEYEVSYRMEARLMAPLRFVGRGLYKAAEYLNDLDPWTQQKIGDWLNPREYPSNIGGRYPEPVYALFPSDYEMSGTNYLGSFVVETITSGQIMSNQRFVEYLDFKYNIDASTIHQINVRRHLTEYLYSPPGG